MTSSAVLGDVDERTSVVVTDDITSGDDVVCDDVIEICADDVSVVCVLTDAGESVSKMA